ncbi:MAG TPA: hypothetical protein VH834_08575 [Solirubrobacteraceae bacterium]|jgi:hypothetical protein
MEDLAAAIADGTSAARLRAMLDAELARGVRELAQKRSGYDRPLIVAVGPAPTALRAVAPAAPALRADPDAVNERTWLLVAALVGALVEATGHGEVRAGALGEHLVLEVPGDPEVAEFVPIAFEDHVEPIDRLRARALAVPGHVLDAADDIRDPIGPDHPLVVAAHVAALGGRPADEASMEEYEDAVLAALDATPGVARPHDDPDPARRVARRILQRLDGMGKWGGYHTEFAHLARGFAGNDRALAEAVGEVLLTAGLLAEKPSVGQRHVFLNPRRAREIHALIDSGDVPADVQLPA